MRALFWMVGVLLLAGCMKVSDMAQGTAAHLRDAGFLDKSTTERVVNWRLQPDSFIYISQGHFMPDGSAYPKPNVVAEQAYNGFIEYFPLVRRATAPLGLEQAMQEAKHFGAHYLLYARFASADDRIGTRVEWEDQQSLRRLGLDKGVIQLMLIETNTGYLIDTTRIRSRGGFLTFYDNRPEDLIAAPLRDYAQRLIGLGR